MCRKKKRVIHPRYHSPCQTPYTALRSLLSVALSSGMVKSNLIIPFISDKVNVQPFRRHCSVISDEGVQFKTARVFNSTAIFKNISTIAIVPSKTSRIKPVVMSAADGGMTTSAKMILYGRHTTVLIKRTMHGI